MLVQASLKTKSAVLRIFFNKTLQSNILRLPNTNILLLTEVNLHRRIETFYSFTLSPFSSGYALMRFVMFFNWIVFNFLEIRNISVLFIILIYFWQCINV